MGVYITHQGLSNVKTYKYVGVDKSIVANYIMQPFWRWAVNFLPMWMAPNMVTLVGFIFIIMSYLLTTYYHPSIGGVAPSWVYVVNALFMFFYQTMDALDGKQARRTNTSSPLGELFDHGCDAVTTVLEVLIVGCSLHLDHNLLLLIAVLMLSAFYLTQWEEYYTGEMVLGYVGVTEAQIASMMVYVMTAIEGPGFWQHTLTWGGISISYGAASVCLGVVSSSATIVSNFLVLWNLSRKASEDKPFSFVKALSGTLPIFTLSGTFVLWAFLSPNDVFKQHTHFFILAYGFLVANLVGRVVLARVCAERFPNARYLLLPLVLVPVTILTKGSLFSEQAYLVAYCCFAIGAYLHLAVNIIKDLCKALKIRCFHVPAKRT